MLANLFCNYKVSGDFRVAALKSQETLELPFAGPGGSPRPANCNSKVFGDFRVATLKSQETLELKFVGLPSEVASFEVASFDAAALDTAAAQRRRGHLGANKGNYI